MRPIFKAIDLPSLPTRNWLEDDEIHSRTLELLYGLWPLSRKTHSAEQRRDAESLYREISNYGMRFLLIDSEHRHPFFDRRFVQYVLSLPPGMKRLGGASRALQRKAFRSLLPEAIIKRESKGGNLETVSVSFRREWKTIERILENSLLVQSGFVSKKKYREGMQRARYGSSEDCMTGLGYLSMDVWLSRVRLL